MATDLETALERLDGYLSSAEVSRYWLPGLTPDELANSLGKIVQTPIPRDAITWFGWHGGIDDDAVTAAVKNGRKHIWTGMTPDGVVHSGVAAILSHLEIYLETLNEQASAIWTQHEMFPIAIDSDAGIRWLHRKNEEQEWQLWQTGKEFCLDPQWHAFNERPEDGPTLLDWVNALSDAFENGTAGINDDGAVISNLGHIDIQYCYYPWPGLISDDQ